MVGVAMAPFIGRFIDFLVPWHASLVACLALVVFQIVQVVGNGLNIAAVIIATIGLDVFRQMLETSLATSIFRFVLLSILCIVPSLWSPLTYISVFLPSVSLLKLEHV